MATEGKFSKFFFAFLLIPFLYSCYSAKLPSINKNFEKKYGKQVEKIRLERAPSPDAKKQVTVFQSYADLDMSDVRNPSRNRYAYVAVTKFGERPSQNYLPNYEDYQQAGSQLGALPSDIFEITYSTNPHSPFHRAGAEFDRILIPEQDVYGVQTAMSEKSYLLIGNGSLQKNVIGIQNDKTKSDIEASEVLIREQQELKRKQKMIRIFGKDSVELAYLEKEDAKKTTVEDNQKNVSNKSSNNAQSGFVSRAISKVSK